MSQEPPVTVYFNPQKKGDTWRLITFGPILINDIQPLATIASCRLYFRQSGVLKYKLENSPASGEGTITITNATTWIITIPLQILGLEVGSFDWDLEIVDSNGVVLSPYEGVLKITKEQSYDD